MSLRKNIIFNYASQLYVTGLGILILPLYIKYMGAEAYGLVGFFTMLQAWFAMLDLGLTPTISRETARYFGGSMSSLNYRQLFRALNVIFIVIALLGGFTLILLADLITQKWLKFQNLSMEDVIVCVQIMGLSVALRWMSGLYRGVITGAEQLVWLSGFNAIIATLRFIIVFITMRIFGFTPLVFFFHQLGVIIIEIVFLCWKTNQLLPKKDVLKTKIGWSIQPIGPVLKFSLSIAFTSMVWVLVTQTDKLVLSGILPLGEYGHFTLAVLVASGIMIISGPVSGAIMPRMASLYAQGNISELIRVYRNSTQLVSVIAGTASLVIAFFPEMLLFAWTGDKALTDSVAPILRLYVLGNALLAVGAFPYYLQYALGNLRYHLIGNALMVVFLLPSIIWAAKNYGGTGAGYVWLGLNLSYFIVWVSYVHNKLMPNLNPEWITKDILLIYLPVTVCLVVLTPLQSYIPKDNRLYYLIGLVFISLFALFVAVIASDLGRNKIQKLLVKRNF